MLGSALYYPYRHSKSGVGCAQPFCSGTKFKPLFPQRTAIHIGSLIAKICAQEGYLRPLHCDLHADTLQELGRRMMKLIDSPDSLQAMRYRETDPSVVAMRAGEQMTSEVRRGFHRVGVWPEKLAPGLREVIVGLGLASIHEGKVPPEVRRLLRSHDMSPIHPEKLTSELRRFLRQESESQDGEWLWVDSDFAAAYMAALAAMLSQKVAVSPLTDSEPSLGINLRSLVDDVASYRDTDARGAIVTFVMEGLQVDPETPIHRLLAFRRSRRNQLAELSELFLNLSSKDGKK